MGVNTLIAVLIPSVLSSALAIINIVLNYRKTKEQPTDEVWETTTRLLSGREDISTEAHEFVELYEHLKYFKKIGCYTPASLGISDLLSEYKQARDDKELLSDSDVENS